MFLAAKTAKDAKRKGEMKMKRLISMMIGVMMLCLTGCFEIPVWKYEKYGISAREWVPDEIHAI